LGDKEHAENDYCYLCVVFHVNKLKLYFLKCGIFLSFKK